LGTITNIYSFIKKRLNLLEINTKENYLLIGLTNKVALYFFNPTKNNTLKLIGKPIYIFECEDMINHIKLLYKQGENNEEEVITYLLVIENKGFLHTKQISYLNKTFKESNNKVFDCKIRSSDNSIWSIDAFYPYVAVGGNHKCILINNIEDKSEGEIKKNNLVMSGNNHNVPFVIFSDDGELLACASIDSMIKIYDVYTGQQLKKIRNDTNQWY
jgi:WD40 repeat protein